MNGFQRAVTKEQIQRLDQLAIETIGIPSLVLMENAGRAVSHEVLRSLKKQKQSLVTVVCGMGNNAGDGFVCARHLLNNGITTKVFLIGKKEQLKSDAFLNCQILERLNYPMDSIDGATESFCKDITKSQIVVDAIFGVGLNRDIQEPFKSIIKVLNNRAKRIISIDIPSGLDGTTGKVYGICIKAACTVTFSFTKAGFSKREGPSYVGKVVIADIGIPRWLLNRI